MCQALRDKRNGSMAHCHQLCRQAPFAVDAADLQAGAHCHQSHRDRGIANAVEDWKHKTGRIQSQAVAHKSGCGSYEKRIAGQFVRQASLAVHRRSDFSQKAAYANAIPQSRAPMPARRTAAAPDSV